MASQVFDNNFTRRREVLVRSTYFGYCLAFEFKFVCMGLTVEHPRG